MADRPPPRFQPNKHQRGVKKILEDITGLGVRIVPYFTPGGSATVCYMFKCKHSRDKMPKEEQAEEIHQLHDYVRNMLMKRGGATHRNISLALMADPENLKNAMYPCVGIRFGDVMGTPSADQLAYFAALDMQTQLEGSIAPVTLTAYQRLLREETTFKDAYARELGR